MWYLSFSISLFPGSTTTKVLENLADLTRKLFSWFANSQIKANNNKCHLILSSPKGDAAILKENSAITCSKAKKLLRVYIDYKHFFKHFFKLFSYYLDVLCPLFK